MANASFPPSVVSCHLERNVLPFVTGLIRKARSHHAASAPLAPTEVDFSFLRLDFQRTSAGYGGSEDPVTSVCSGGSAVQKCTGSAPL